MDKSIVDAIPKAESFKVRMKLSDINGEWAKRTHTYEEPVYDIKDKSTISKYTKKGYQHVTQNTDGEKTDVLVRKVTRSMHAFPRDEHGRLLIPMGGVRGYVLGALRAVARNIGVKNGQPLYGILSWMTNGGVQVSPRLVPVGVSKVGTSEFWITEAKSSVFYENIPEAEVTLTFTVQPNSGFNADLIKELLKRAEGVGISPKRRGHWTIMEIN